MALCRFEHPAHSLRWRLLVLVSVASLLIIVLASVLTYGRARHEVQELMDGQMQKVGQLILAQTVDGERGLAQMYERWPHAVGLDPKRDKVPLEFRIGRQDGRLLAQSPRAAPLPLEGRLGFEQHEQDGRLWRRLLLESPDSGLRVLVMASIAQRDKEALEIAIKTFQPLALVFPVLLLLIYLAVWRGLKPLEQLAAELAMRSPDNLAPLVPNQVPREVQPVVDAINRVLRRLGLSLENERRFTADAAHELRTPLAAARIQAQVARLASDAGPRERAIDQTLAAIDRATHLVEQMLRLARLDPLARLQEARPVVLADVLERVRMEVLDSAPQALVQLDIEDALQTVDADPDLLVIALRNLIDNAIRYASPAGRIVLFLRTQGDECQVGVADQGAGVDPAILPKLGERFFRGPMVENGSGSGLGLTIVGRIADLHGAALKLRNLEPQGFEVSLVWKSRSKR